MKYLYVLLTVLCSACLGKPGTACEDVVCSDDRTCAVIASGDVRCVTPDQRTQCENKNDGDACGELGVCSGGVCLARGCGDGFVLDAEQCDGANLGSATGSDGVVDCRDLGYYEPGNLGCRSDCTFERAGCNNAGICGDGVKNGDEQCDAADIPSGKSCLDGGFHKAEGLACNSACRLDFGACEERCGDGKLNGPEECDGSATTLTNHDSNSVIDCRDVEVLPGSNRYYYDTASPGCRSNCTIDYSACTQYCGDGVIDGPQGVEVCDAVDVGSASCATTFGKYAGIVTCSADCASLVPLCVGECGDGVKNGPEVCDSLDVGGLTCADLNPPRYAGAYGCNSTCTALTNTCSGYLGDGTINGGEQCDIAGAGVFPAGVTCESFGYHGDGSALVCSVGAISEAGCATNGFCGDGVLQDGEACDGFTRGIDCRSVSARGHVGCDANCQFAFAGCEDSFWSRIAIPPFDEGMTMSPDPHDLWSDADTSAWVVGPQLLAQWDGTRWIDRRQGGPSSGEIVWGNAESVWVVMGSAVYRWDWQDGSADGMWTTETAPSGIRDLWGDETRLWAATANGVFVRTPMMFGMGIWTMAVPGDFATVQGRNGVVMAAGRPNPHNLAVFADSTWTLETVIDRDFGFPLDLEGVSVLARDYAVFLTESRSLVVWNGFEGWAHSIDGPQIDYQIIDVYAAEHDDIWVLAQRQGDQTLRLVRYRGQEGGTNATEVPASLGASLGQPRLVGFGAGNIWVLGQGGVSQYEGPGWTAPYMRTMRWFPPEPNPYNIPSPIQADIDYGAIDVHDGVAVMALRCMGGDCMTTMGESHMFEYRLEDRAPIAPEQNHSARAFTNIRVPFTSDVLHVAIDDAGREWAATASEIRAVKWIDGAADPLPSPLSVGPDEVTAAWTIGSHALFAVASDPAGFIVRFDGTAWQPGLAIDGNGEVIGRVNDMDGTAADDVWVVGSPPGGGGARLGRWDGSAWTILPIDSLLQGVPIDDVTGIWVAGRHEAWITANTLFSGVVIQVIWRDDGTVTAREVAPIDGIPPARLNGLWGANGRDIWFVGSEPEVLHYDGMDLAKIPVTARNLVAIDGSGPNDVWAVGDDFAVLRLTHPLPFDTAGECRDAVPFYCSTAPQSVTSTIAPGETVYYRLHAPISSAPFETLGVLSVELDGIDTVMTPGLVPRRGRQSSRTLCDGPGDERPAPYSTALVRGETRYIGVRSTDTVPQTYTLRWDCELVQNP